MTALDNADREALPVPAGDQGAVNAEPTPGPWECERFSSGSVKLSALAAIAKAEGRT